MKYVFRVLNLLNRFAVFVFQDDTKSHHKLSATCERPKGYHTTKLSSDRLSRFILLPSPDPNASVSKVLRPEQRERPGVDQASLYYVAIQKRRPRLVAKEWLLFPFAINN